jgi:hypothetical protein
MKTNTILLLIALFISPLTYGCKTKGSGKVTSELRSAEIFNGVEMKNAANIYITQGDKQEIRVEAEDNLISHIRTTVKNKELIIDNDQEINNTQPINIYITVKEICLIELSGSGNIITKNQLNCDNMVMRLSGSGDIRASLSSNSIKTTLSGSGNLNLKGISAASDIRLSGSGNIDARELKTTSSNISITGSGTSTVDVHDALTVNITGSGNVYYISEPDRINSKIIGSGEILKI